MTGVELSIAIDPNLVLVVNDRHLNERLGVGRLNGKGRLVPWRALERVAAGHPLAPGKLSEHDRIELLGRVDQRQGAAAPLLGVGQRDPGDEGLVGKTGRRFSRRLVRPAGPGMAVQRRQHREDACREATRSADPHFRSPSVLRNSRQQNRRAAGFIPARPRAPGQTRRLAASCVNGFQYGLDGMMSHASTRGTRTLPPLEKIVTPTLSLRVG